MQFKLNEIFSKTFLIYADLILKNSKELGSSFHNVVEYKSSNNICHV